MKLLPFIFVDVGKDNGRIDGHPHLVIGWGVFRNEMPVLADLVHEVSEIVPGLAEGVFPHFFSATYEKFELFGISREDLIEGPVFDLKDNEARVFGVEDKIRFLPLDVRLIPGHVRLVGPGAGTEKPVKVPLPRCGEGLYVGRHHCGHVIQNKALLPCPDRADPSCIIRVRRLTDRQSVKERQI